MGSPFAGFRATLGAVSPSHDIGQCRLCRAQRIPLRETALLPEWARARSARVSEALVCAACEERLLREEAGVSGLAYDGSGQLGLLRHVAPASGPRADILAASLRGLDPRAMARFAASIFWRAHVSSRPQGKGLFLSNARAESLREYVLGTRPSPWHMCLTLVALIEENPRVRVTTAFPVTESKGEDGWHSFAVDGLVFNLSTGEKAAGAGGICLACGHDPHVIFTDWTRVRHMVTLADALLLGARRTRG
jgi:hypothetical protein